MSEEFDDSDYSEEDPYAAFLNDQDIQERRINKAVENISIFIKKPEQDIKNVLRVALPIISREKITYSSFYGEEDSYIHYVNGLLQAKILKALSDVPAGDRENVLGAAELFYKGVRDKGFPDASLPTIIKALSEVLKEDRKSIVELTYPYYIIYSENEGYGFSNGYIAFIIKAISNIPSNERDNVMVQITPKITQILPYLTKECGFTTYSDGGDNGKRKNQHGQMIEALALVPRKDRMSVLEHTFLQDHILGKEHTYKDRRGRTKSIERSYAHIDEILYKKMKVLIEIPSNERKDILEKSKLLLDEDIRYPGPIEILIALSKFRGQQIDSIIIETLVRKKRGEDYISILKALSEISEDQRTDVWEVFESLDEILMNPFDGYRISQIIRTIDKISSDQRRSIINQSLPLILSTKKDKFYDNPSTLIEIIANIREEERQDVLDNFMIFVCKKQLNISECPEILQSIAKVSQDQRNDLMQTLTQPFLINLKEGGYGRSYQTPWGNSIKFTSWAIILQSLARVQADERADMIKAAASLFNGEISREEYAQIIEVLSNIPLQERSNLITNTFFKSKNPHDLVDLLIVFSKIREEYRAGVMEAFEFFLNQKFMKGYSGYNDPKIIQTLARIPGNYRIDMITSSIPLFVSESNRCHRKESLIEINLRIIESVAEIPTNERLNVIFQALRICTEEVDSTFMVIRPATHAPQIKMLSYARSIIISSLAKVNREERNDLVKLVSRFEIKNHGDSYTALIIREIASMPVSKRNNALRACDLGNQKQRRYKVEESRQSLRKGFESFVQYLLESVYSEVFHLKIISAVSKISDEDKRKLSKYAESVFANIQESDVGDILIKVCNNLSQQTHQYPC